MTDKNTLIQWQKEITDAVASDSYVKLVINKPTSAAGDLKSIDVRQILVKRELKLSFTYHHKTNDIVKNYTPDESAVLISKLLKEQFNQARLYTTAKNLLLAKTGAGFEIKHEAPTQAEVPDLSHDRTKHYLINSVGKPYLHALGIADAQGKIYKATQDKFRQINKYIEILDGLIKGLPKCETLRIVDMGAGKGYLTFALYDYLVNTLKINAQVVGVEYRADLVNLCNKIAKDNVLGGLSFVQGSIADYNCAGADVVIALHACDTATDDAVNKAIRADASLIVVAPCCHKQIRAEMRPASDNPLDFLLKYGTYTERLAEMITDGMRAQIMELSGYSTNLFEFIGGEHTPKNVMIVATKSSAQKPKDIESLKSSLAKTKEQFGIKYHQLEKLLGL